MYFDPSSLARISTLLPLLLPKLNTRELGEEKKGDKPYAV